MHNPHYLPGAMYNLDQKRLSNPLNQRSFLAAVDEKNDESDENNDDDFQQNLLHNILEPIDEDHNLREPQMQVIIPL